MKEKLDLNVISEKFHDAEPQNVHAYPFPNATATLTPEAEFWCALSMKPVGATIKIPKRQFIGESLELTEKINNTIEKEINKILQQ